MIKVTCTVSLLGMMFILIGCAPTAYVVGTTNQPIQYTYAPGYNPPQVAYPDVPVDANTSIDSAEVVQQEHKINAINDSIAIKEKQDEAARRQAIQLQLNALPKIQ
ncbi:hypothetical protein DGG96_11580 [Legionella qingyii]|uniref:Uncharacterized protein n=1 Tax=Legionella qingyii TaxID=2184757 RepID=A0A317U2K5_9GAMM|nr:hypothetical protein [Legionella qingyii]PWY54540.1 hypothetical protein DGG96_16150 [Legionella qingyii]PWY55560.1 hypothetical protein DGG96_11580 [Legionella qingyii]RUR21432.1 hypothetical protein ELY20_12050 [Legionella qingyii]RUR24749.1 hypothetical protein ELY16_11270 [Legionella qingyii]